jgi:hypothetical protein
LSGFVNLAEDEMYIRKIMAALQVDLTTLTKYFLVSTITVSLGTRVKITTVWHIVKILDKGDVIKLKGGIINVRSRAYGMLRNI